MADLTITNNTLRYGAQVFAIHNITQIRVDPWKRLPRIGARVMVGLLVVAWLLCYLDPLFAQSFFNAIFEKHVNQPPGLYFLVGLAAFCLFVYGLWDRTKLKQYTLYLETSSGSSKLFSSSDRRGIGKIAGAIQTVMEHRDTPVAYHVNVDQSKITLGDEFSNIAEGVNIINRSKVDK